MAKILVGPVSVNTTLGSTALFTCTGINGFLFAWYINGMLSSLKENSHRGATISVSENSQLQSVLSIPAYQVNHNISVYCKLYSFTKFKVPPTSPLVYLMIQGPLSPVQNLTYSFADSATINVSWTPPFTLPGTHINGYNVFVTAKGFTANYFTSESFCMLNLNISNSSCDVMNITISGYNGLNGEANSLSEIYLPTDVDSITELPVNLEISQDQQLHITVNATDLCIGQRPTFADIKIYEGDRFYSHHEEVVLVEVAKDVVSASIVLPKDKKLLLLLSFGNPVGNEFSNFTQYFSTHDVQSVYSVIDITGETCIICTFSSFSTDEGCTIEILTPDQIVQYTKTLIKSTDSNIAKGCISDVASGLYNIRAYDIGSFEIAAEEIGVVIVDPRSTSSVQSFSLSSDIDVIVTTDFLVSSVILNIQETDSTFHDKASNSFTRILTIVIPSVLVSLILVVAMMIALITVTRKVALSKNREGFDVTVSENQAYSDVNQTLRMINTQRRMVTTINQSYEFVNPSQLESRVYEVITF